MILCIFGAEKLKLTINEGCDFVAIGSSYVCVLCTGPRCISIGRPFGWGWREAVCSWTALWGCTVASLLVSD